MSPAPPLSRAGVKPCRISCNLWKRCRSDYDRNPLCGPVLVPVRASPVPSVVRGSFVVRFCVDASSRKHETLAGEVPLLSPETPTEEAFPSSAASLPATYPPSPMEPARCATNPFLDTRIVAASAFEATEARAAHFYSFGIASLLTKRLNELTPIRWPERERDRLRYHVEASQPAGRARWDVMPVLGTCDRLELLRAGPGWDGSTYACGLDALDEACVVVSVGGLEQPVRLRERDRPAHTLPN